jgi:predicted Rdx family selenoprotein
VIGEVALQPGTGGVFAVDIFHRPPASAESGLAEGGVGDVGVKATRLWDRKEMGGFPGECVSGYPVEGRNG